MFLNPNPRLYGQAVKLRHEPSKAEAQVWELVRKKQFGHRFHRQKIIGNYIADFWCPSLRLVIEMDGPSHAQQENQDALRDGKLYALGVKKIVRLPTGLNLPQLIETLERSIGTKFGMGVISTNESIILAPETQEYFSHPRGDDPQPPVIISLEEKANEIGLLKKVTVERERLSWAWKNPT